MCGQLPPLPPVPRSNACGRREARDQEKWGGGGKTNGGGGGRQEKEYHIGGWGEADGGGGGETNIERETHSI